jgi:hypothetical protein
MEIFENYEIHFKINGWLFDSENFKLRTFGKISINWNILKMQELV